MLSAGQDQREEPSGCAFEGEHVGRLSAKISDAHKVITAEDQDGAKKIYTSSRLLAEIVKTQQQQSELLDAIHRETQQQALLIEAIHSQLRSCQGRPGLYRSQDGSTL